MNFKIKNTKLAFIVIAGLIFFSLALFSVADETNTSNKNIFQDSDQDGLSDDEERTYGTDPNNRDTDSDGYTDGAEVKSGYNPLKPAPGDKIVSNETKKEVVAVQGVATEEDDENLTEDISQQVANLISEKSGENQEIAFEDLDSIIQKVTGDSLAFEDLPEIDEASIKIKKQSYSKLSEEEREAKEKEDEQEYLVAVSYILISNSPDKISDKKDLDNFSQEIISKVMLFSGDMTNVSYFKDMAEKGEDVLEQMKEVEVPEKMLDVHKKGLQLANYAISLKDSASPDEADPIGTITKLSKIQNLMTLGVAFSQEIVTRFSGVEVSDLPIEL